MSFTGLSHYPECPMGATDGSSLQFLIIYAEVSSKPEKGQIKVCSDRPLSLEWRNP